LINIVLKTYDDGSKYITSALWASEPDETIDDCPICLPQLVDHLQTTSAIDGLYRTIEIEINPEEEEEEEEENV
jgi:hypothetical protein